MNYLPATPPTVCVDDEVDFDFDNLFQHTRIGVSEQNNSISKINDCEKKQTECYINDKLLVWSVKNNISQTATNELLKVLRSHECFKSFPSDSRSLRKTQKRFTYRAVNSGKYIWDYRQDYGQNIEQ